MKFFRSCWQFKKFDGPRPWLQSILFYGLAVLCYGLAVFCYDLAVLCYGLAILCFQSGRILVLRLGRMLFLWPGRILSLRPGVILLLRPGRIPSLRPDPILSTAWPHVFYGMAAFYFPAWPYRISKTGPIRFLRSGLMLFLWPWSNHRLFYGYGRRLINLRLWSQAKSFCGHGPIIRTLRSLLFSRPRPYPKLIDGDNPTIDTLRPRP